MKTLISITKGLFEILMPVLSGVLCALVLSVLGELDELICIPILAMCVGTAYNMATNH